MSDKGVLMVGVRIRQIVTASNAWHDVTVQHSDSVGVVFEVQRAVSEGGQIETVVSQILVPWAQVQYLVLMEERI
ncbi:MAG: hypothetical protein NDJ94_04265 [Vicinamibacteria bacterium]|nr:hypothetical protein [Vicinamibacteria bacterium]